MANWAVRTQKSARRMWELGFFPVLLSNRPGVVANNAISPFSSIRSATANRRLLGSGDNNKVSGVFPASLRFFCSFAAHSITLQHHHEEREKSALAPEPKPERSTYPVLMVPGPERQMEAEDDDEYYHYFHFADFKEIEEEITQKVQKVRRIRKRRILGAGKYECVGSSHGWHAIMIPNSFKICFLKLLIHSDDNNRIFGLPPIPANNLEGGGGGVPFIQKVALSSPPYEDSYMAAAIYGPGRDVAFYESKDQTWWTPGGGVGDFSDVIYSKKDGLFYTIRNPQANCKYYDSPIQAWDPFSRRSTWIHPSFDEPQSHFLSDKPFKNAFALPPYVDEKRYLVESSPSGGGSGGDLFLVLRYICKCVDKDHNFDPPEDYSQYDIDFDPSITYRTFRIFVYKLNRDNDGSSYWVRQYDDLGGQCFFVGMNHSFSVPVPEESVLGENCVFYSDDCFDKMHLVSNSGGHDNGFSHIGDPKSRIFYNNDLSKYKLPPIWLDV